MMRLARLLVLPWLALLAACSTPITVKYVSAREAHKALTENALSAGVPSQWSRQLLNRNGLYERYQADPVAVLDTLYQLLRQHETPERLYALAELSFLHAQKFAIREYYLAAAVLAYAYLLPENEKTLVSPLDPRGRIAVDIYNRGLAEGLATPGTGQVTLQSATYLLPFGSLRITTDPDQFLWAGFRFKSFVPVGHFAVHGLRNRYRQAGVGAPLAAEIDPEGTGPAAEAARKRIPLRTKVPVTVFLRIADPLQALLAGTLEGRLELYTADSAASLRVGERDVPLEFESTAAIAYQLDGAPVWNTEISGFRFAEAPVLGDGLIMLQPYRPGRIPVVFVHGTASSPARWAEMYNEVLNDAVLRGRFQFWLFQYHTGQPILYSALQLRRGIRAALQEVDPGRQDDALRDMVIIGHSQGGLLAKLMVVDSGTRFWDNVTPVPFEEFQAPAETRDLLRESMFLEPLPDVTRVIFIATPHGGSFLASGPLQSIVRRLITLPERLVQNTQGLFRASEFAESGMGQLPTSVDNMRPGTRFITTLASLPIAPGVKAHSIIAVSGPGSPALQNDGVVAYQSAHIEGVESELVVRSSHSTQGVPATIQEVRRILRSHVGIGVDPDDD